MTRPDPTDPALQDEGAPGVKADAAPDGPSPPAEVAEPFWRAKPLEAMTDAEWESLCDGCARCCLVKLEDEDTGMIYPTDVGCTLLDGETCRCRDYPGRQARVPDCLKLTPDTVRALGWLPPTCAYRRLAEGRDLLWWHPLVSGDPDTVHAAGVSVRGRVAGPEEDFPLDALLEHVVRWPDRVPRGAGAKRPDRARMPRRGQP